MDRSKVSNESQNSSTGRQGVCILRTFDMRYVYAIQSLMKMTYEAKVFWLTGKSSDEREVRGGERDDEEDKRTVPGFKEPELVS